MDVAEERWRDVRRTRLLEAAERVFARLGYAAASVEDIAFEAGIGKPTLYRYFPGKAALFEAVFVHTLDGLERRLDDALVAPAPFSERLSRLLRELVPVFRAHIVTLGNLPESDEISKRRLFQQRRSRIEARLESAMEAARAAGEIRDIDPAIAARFMIGLLWSGSKSRLSDDDAVVAAIVDFAFNGLGGGGRA